MMWLYFFGNITKIDDDGVRRIPLSSSPEVFDNSLTFAKGFPYKDSK